MVNDGSTYTVDDALLALGFGNFQVLVLGYAGMGWISEAMEMMLLSFVGPAVQSEWGLSAHEESLITSAVFVGMLVGAYSWGLISDSYGRRKGFFVTALITAGAGFLSAFSPNYTSLIVLRCLVGVGLGGGPVLSSWFLEFIPAPDRGTWMVVFSAFWTVGTVLEASLAWVIMPTLGWRWLLAISSLPSLVLLLFYGVVPESPRYLCMKGRTTDSLQILDKIAKLNQKQLPSGVLVSDLDHKELEEKTSLSEDSQLLSPRRQEKTSLSEDSQLLSPRRQEKTSLPEESQLLSPRRHESAIATNPELKGGFTSFFVLFSPKLLKSTLLLWVVFFGNAFSYYGLVLLTSELSNANRECTSSALQSSNSKDTNLYKDVFITSFAEIPGLLLSAVIVDRLGRKLSMSGMFFLCCIFLLPLVVQQSENLTTCLLFGARLCITGTFTIVYIYAPEIYPTSVRTTGVGVASAMGRFGGIFCPLVAVGLVHGCHQSYAVVLFEFVVFLSGLAVLLFPLETKGLALSDIVISSK